MHDRTMTSAIAAQLSTVLLLIAVTAAAAASLPAGVYPSHAGAPSLSCSYNGVDYSSLSNVYFSVQNSSYNHSYSVQVCRGLIWDPPQPLPAESSCIWLTSFASVCLVDSTNEVQQGAATYGAGEWASASWSALQANDEAADDALSSSASVGVAVHLWGERSCRDSAGSLLQWSSTIQLLCADALSSMTVNQIDECTFTFTIQTPLACGAATEAEQ